MPGWSSLRHSISALAKTPPGAVPTQREASVGVQTLACFSALRAERACFLVRWFPWFIASAMMLEVLARQAGPVQYQNRQSGHQWTGVVFRFMCQLRRARSGQARMGSLAQPWARADWSTS